MEKSAVRLMLSSGARGYRDCVTKTLQFLNKHDCIIWSMLGNNSFQAGGNINKTFFLDP